MLGRLLKRPRVSITTNTSDDPHSLLIQSHVDWMSKELFDLDYSNLKKIIYPAPRYKTFTLTKRDGSPRIIHEPRKQLKNLQEKILKYLYETASNPKPCVHGFTPGRSIRTNAAVHCSPKTQILLNIDIEDFFPSITFYRVRGLFQSKPFDCSYSVASVLAHICTFNGVLPQGAPTSPLIANLICRSLDSDLMKLAKRHRATYTRYADDITFSFSTKHSANLPSNICTFDSGNLVIGNELLSIFQTHSFRLNPNKSRLSSRQNRLEVTGLTINEFPNVKRLFIDRIRGALHAWEVYGYDKAQSRWANIPLSALPYERRPWKRQTRTGELPELKNVLWGKLLYLRMVRGREDSIYIKLAEKYNSLCLGEKMAGKFVCSGLPVDTIVRTKSGADKAVYVLEWSGDYIHPGTTESEVVASQGTAFAYENYGLITCDHVLNFSEHISTTATAPEIKNLTIEVKNTTTGESWPVDVVHRDAARDLALLRFKDHKPPHYYFVGRATPLKIGASGVLIGYPNYSPGKQQANYLTASILNRFNRSALSRIEISGNIRKGNSGGPFVDASFNLVGVAQQGSTQETGNDECLCVEELNKWLVGL